MSYFLNVSEEHKFFLWSPAKTGSHSFINIFGNFSFYKWEFNDDGSLLFKGDKIIHQHYCRFFKGSENYQLISSVRNPYSWLYSYGRLDSTDRRTATERLERFLLHKTKSSPDCCDCYSSLVPDHFIRLENLFEDYSKFDFIRNSDFYKSGRLFDECKIRYNATGTEIDEWKKFYTQNLADLVYYSYANYFEKVGYHKDSWMS